MALSPWLQSREFDKFKEVNGQTSVAVSVEGVSGASEKGTQAGYSGDPAGLNPEISRGSLSEVFVDDRHNLRVRGVAGNEDEAFSDDFSSADYAAAAFDQTLTGTFTFTTGSKTVTGSGGTLFRTQLSNDWYVRLASDPVSSYARIRSIVSDTELELEDAYTGTDGSGAANKSFWIYSQSGGASHLFSSSEVRITPSTTLNAEFQMYRHVSMVPMVCEFTMSLASKVSGTKYRIGWFDNTGTQWDLSNNAAYFEMSASHVSNTNCQLGARNGPAATDSAISATAVITATSIEQTYRLILSQHSISLWQNEVFLGRLTQRMPRPWKKMFFGVLVHNQGTPASSQTINIENIYLKALSHKEEISWRPFTMIGGLASSIGSPQSVVVTSTTPASTANSLAVRLAGTGNVVDTELSGTIGGTDNNSGLTGPTVASIGLAFDGANFDRIRTAEVGSNVGATGLLAHVDYGLVDDVASFVAENNYGSIKMTPERAKHVHLRDNSGREIQYGNREQDTFTVAANGSLRTDLTGKKYFSLQVKGTGAAATAWDVILEGSNNSTDFTTILQHTTVTGDGVTLQQAAGVATPYAYYRTRCVSITLGGATNIVASIMAMK